MVAAHKAGDTKSAEILAGEIRRMQGAQAAQPEEPTRPQMSGGEYAKGLGRAALQGLTFNFGDEILAGLQAPFSDKTYSQLRDEERNSIARFAEENPYTAFGTEAAGSIPTAVAAMFIPGGQAAAAGALGRVANIGRKLLAGSSPLRTAAKVGAATGAVTGAGSAEEVQDIMPESAFGAGFGGALGAAVPTVGKLAAPIYRNVADRMSENAAVGHARDYVLKMMEKGESPTTIDDLRAGLKADKRMGVPLGIQYQSPQLGRAFEVAALKSGEGEDLALQAMRTNQGTVARTMNQLNKTLKPDDYFDAEDAIINKMRTSAEPFYQKAYAAGKSIKETPELTGLLNQPGARAIWEEALSDPRYTLLGGKPGEMVWQDGERVMAEPSLELMDQFKRAIDRKISTIEAQPVKRGTVHPDLPGIREFRSRFLDALENSLPKEARDAWREARSVYKGDAEIRDALRFGRDEFMNIEPQRWAKFIAEANTPLEQEALRTGAFEAMRRHYRAATQTLDPHEADRARAAAGQIVGNPEIREKLQMIAPGPRDYQKLEDSLMREAQIYGQNQRAVAGSPTARRTEASKEFDQVSTGAQMLADVVGMAANPTPLNVATRAANIWQRQAVPEARSQELARIFSGKTPQEIEAILGELEAHAQRRAGQAQQYQRAAGSGPVTGVQTVVGQTPEEKTPDEVIGDLRQGRF
jgi:hypothetical protein